MRDRKGGQKVGDSRLAIKPISNNVGGVKHVLGQTSLVRLRADHCAHSSSRTLALTAAPCPYARAGGPKPTPSGSVVGCRNFHGAYSYPFSRLTLCGEVLTLI